MPDPVPPTPVPIDWNQILNRILDIVEKCLEDMDDEVVAQRIKNPNRRQCLSVTADGGPRGWLARAKAVREAAAEVTDEEVAEIIAAAKERKVA